MSIIRNVVIMASGETPRLKPLTDQRPKALLPICCKPPIIQLVEQFVSTAGTSHFYIKMREHAGHISHALTPFHQFSTDNVPEVRIHQRYEYLPYYTGDGVKRIFNGNDFPKDESVAVVGADIFAPFVDFGKMMSVHQRALESNAKLLATLGIAFASAREAVGRFGVVAVDDNGFISEFVEKPKTLEQVKQIAGRTTFDPLRRLIDEKSASAGEDVVAVNSCMFILSPRFFDRVEDPQLDVGVWGFSEHIFPSITGIGLAAHIIDSCWIDIDYPEDYWRAQYSFKAIAGRSTSGEIFKNWGSIGTGCDIDEATKHNSNNLWSHSIIGNAVTLENVTLDNSFVFWDCKLKDVTIKNTVVLPHTYINLLGGGIQEISNSIIGGKVHGGSFIDAELFHGNGRIDRQLVVTDYWGRPITRQLSIGDKDVEKAQKLLPI